MSAFSEIAEIDPRVLEIRDILLKSELKSSSLLAVFRVTQEGENSIELPLKRVCLRRELIMFISQFTMEGRMAYAPHFYKGCVIVVKNEDTGELHLFSVEYQEQDGGSVSAGTLLFTIKPDLGRRPYIH